MPLTPEYSFLDNGYYFTRYLTIGWRHHKPESVGVTLLKKETLKSPHSLLDNKSLLKEVWSLGSESET